jgi:cupin fold WbuC family metalloprotein
MANINEVYSIDRAVISEMTRHATKSQRKRVHLLLHAGHSDQVQRLVIFMQPGTYVRPHHHRLQWEMLILIQGRGALLTFAEEGEIVGRLEMDAETPVVQIPAGTWHGFVVLEPDTVVMELKPGPYQPSEFANWAPPEGDATATTFLRSLGSPH